MTNQKRKGEWMAIKSIMFQRGNVKTIDIWNLEALYAGLLPGELYGEDDFRRRLEWETDNFRALRARASEAEALREKEKVASFSVRNV